MMDTWLEWLDELLLAFENNDNADRIFIKEQFLLKKALFECEEGKNNPLIALFSAFSCSGAERVAILLAFAYEKYKKYGQLYGLLLGQGTQNCATMRLSEEVYYFYGQEKSFALQDPCSPLRQMVFLYDGNNNLKIHPRVYCWLCGQEDIFGGLEGICSVCPEPKEPILVQQNQYQELIAAANSSTCGVIWLCGREGSGASFLLSHYGFDYGIKIFNVDVEAIFEHTAHEQQVLLNNIDLEIRLSGGLLHLCHLPTHWEESRRVQQRLWKISEKVFISAQEPYPLLDSPVSLWIELDRLNIGQRLAIWQAQAVQWDDSTDLLEYASGYNLTPGRIQMICKEAIATAQAKGEETVSRGILLEIATRGSTIELSKLASKAPTTTLGWEDLILPSEQKDILSLVMGRLQMRQQVDETWRFEEKMPYGRGLSLLFAGPPGTGKTMAAQVLAKELGKALFVVDLSRLNSKYIGESEKNIAKIFQAAKDSYSILFFDEADALFAKRTDVTTSNDRHANAGIAFLLQQMEQYEGMCILSTNLFQNFDKAFVRRISFVVRFQRPDAQTRELLWRGAFPMNAPLNPSINWHSLGEQIEFSGSEIKSVAYNSAFMAANEGIPIDPSHISRALRLEYDKMGVLIPRDLLLWKTGN